MPTTSAAGVSAGLEPDAGRVSIALGARWGRGRSRSGVEVEGDLVVESVHQVPVSIHGDGDRSVSESGLDCLGMLAVGDQPGGMGMT